MVCNIDAMIDLGSETYRFFLGSNKVMQVALGRQASEEIRSGIFEASKVVYSCYLRWLLNPLWYIRFLLYLHMLCNVSFS